MLTSYLPAIWFVLWGLLWAIYFAVDGFDLGAGMLAGLLPDKEAEMLVRTLGPVWDGNEVWLITAGGVTFAAFPRLYATMFSSLYAPLMMVLMALIMRAVAIEFSHMRESIAWQRAWTRVLAIASLLVALLLGVAFGNIFRGLPLDQSGYHGTLLTLLNPYGILTGVLFVVAFLYNGATWMMHKSTEPVLRAWGSRFAHNLWTGFLAMAALFLVVTPFTTGLFANYAAHPALLLVPLVAVVSLVVARVWQQEKPGRALLAGSAAVLLTVMSGVIGLFPNMFPSSLDPAAGLTAANSASSPATLQLMLIVTVIFLPLVLIYQVWFYKLFGSGAGESDGSLEDGQSLDEETGY